MFNNECFAGRPEEPSSGLAYEEPPRFQVLPTNVGLPFGRGIPRRRSSTTDEEAVWEESNPEPAVFKLPAAAILPEEPSEPSPTPYSTYSVFPAGSSHQPAAYDYVPDPGQSTKPHSSAISASKTEAREIPQFGSSYDYVPDEPPAIQATFTRDLYEEPPPEAAPPVPNSNGDTGLTAIALYEYEKQDDDEIGFDVNDIITNIEQVDAGWWRGFSKGRYGLFPRYGLL